MSREHLAHANVAGAPIWVKVLWRHVQIKISKFEA
jgi:hypothetical protein